MDSAIVGASIAGGIALVSIIVSAVQQRQQAANQAADQLEARKSAERARREDAENQRVERRYEDRLKFQIEFVEEADQLMAHALDVEVRQHGTDMPGPPGDYLDGVEHEPMVRQLRAALSRLHLVSGQACRSAASDLERLVSKHTWDWKDYDAVQEARVAFLAAARSDLGLPDGSFAPADPEGPLGA